MKHLTLLAAIVVAMFAATANAQCANGVCSGPPPMIQSAPIYHAPAYQPQARYQPQPRYQPAQAAPYGNAIQMTFRSPVLVRRISEPQPMPPQPAIRMSYQPQPFYGGNCYQPQPRFSAPPAYVQQYQPMRYAPRPVYSSRTATAAPSTCAGGICRGPDPFLRQ